MFALYQPNLNFNFTRVSTTCAPSVKTNFIHAQPIIGHKIWVSKDLFFIFLGKLQVF